MAIFLQDKKRMKLFTAGMLLSGILLGQTPEQDEGPAAVFRSDSRLVQLHVTVTDPEGHLITNLPQSAFHVYENDAQQQISVFRQEDAPISLGVIIDNSASMREKRDRVNAAALDLVRASNPQDEVFIMSFSDAPAIVQDFTRNRESMESALAKAEPSGATAMRDAVLMAIEHVRRLGQEDKKSVLVVTDGEDNASMTTLDRVVRAAQNYGILVYAVGLLADETERAAKRARSDLDAITLATGGEAFYPKNVAEVDEIAKHVAHDLRNQYTIAYTPSDDRQDGSYRAIRVDVSVPGAIATTRSGYYAPDSNLTSAAH